jgi:hypothetical protein
VLKFLKGLVGREQRDEYIIQFDDIPALLEEEKEKARNDLNSVSARAREQLEPLRASLLADVHALALPEEKRQMHPKLEKIAASSLPLFERAMAQAIARPFPPDSEEFYTTATDCLKNSLKAVQGPGRYLQAVFPEEMKTIRATIRTFGSAINALTEAMKKYREKDAQIETARESYRKVREIREDQVRSGPHETEIRRQIAAAEQNLRGLKEEENRIRSGPEFSSYSAFEKILREREEDYECTRRDFAGAAAAIVHVFGKAEKISAKKGDSPQKKAIHQVIGLLSGQDLPGAEEMTAALHTALPLVIPLIESGEVPLKNKEERALFSDKDHLISHIILNITENHAAAAALAAAREDYRSHQVPMVLARIESEIREEEKSLAQKEQDLRDCARDRDTAAGSLPSLIRELEQSVSVLKEGPVTVPLQEHPAQ